ncbi:MAG: Tim44 domain-containing protein [Sulfurihydrogenibium sp.]|jgi:predicted lipid-binding transport protein (Tim44 family)|nr:Tim44 domain-containing protein [Sulfurihydrogenibium sp.]
MRKILILLTIFTLLTSLTQDSFARAGKGSSTHFRSYKAQDFNRVNANKHINPSINNPSINPSNAINHQPTHNQMSQQKHSFLKSFFSGLLGALAGMAIFSALSHFLGPQFASQFGAGILGILGLLLLVGLIFFLISLFRKREEPIGAFNTNSNCQSYQYSDSQTQTESSSYIKEDSPYINEELILNLTKNIFYDIQKAWSSGDLSPVKNFLTDRMYQYLEEQLKELKDKGLKNIVENPKIENLEIVHVEEDGDSKVVIVKIDASAIDYTIDSNGNTVEGDKHNPVSFTEYWAFVGKALNWRLDDIKQVGDV